MAAIAIETKMGFIFHFILLLFFLFFPFKGRAGFADSLYTSNIDRSFSLYIFPILS